MKTGDATRTQLSVYKRFFFSPSTKWLSYMYKILVGNKHSIHILLPILMLLKKVNKSSSTKFKQ